MEPATSTSTEKVVETASQSDRLVTSPDDELQAMTTISTAFRDLDHAARDRVLIWIEGRFGSGVAKTGPTAYGARSSKSVSSHTTSGASKPDTSSFQHAAELFDAVRPKGDMDKALTLAYWFQVCKAAGTFGSRVVNDELKAIGHGVSNITRAIDGLCEQRPALAMQLEKSGKSQQSQKKFKLTHEGIKRVELLLAQPQQQEE